MNSDGVHRIRLKGPWHVLPPQSAADDFVRHSMPQDWRQLFGEQAGTAVFRRNFHTPSGLESHERIMIHIPNGVGEVSQFEVNNIAVLPDSTNPLKYDVTEHLAEFNLLQFSLSFDPVSQAGVPGGLWETVFLEIHSP